MKPHFKLIVSALLLASIGAPMLATAATGHVYTWVDKNGVRHYSDQPVNPKATTVKGLHAQMPKSAATIAVANAASAAGKRAAPPPRSASSAHKMTPGERAKLCAKLKQQIKQLTSARRVQVTNGEKKEFLSGQDLVDFRHMQEKKAQKVCATPSSAASR